MIHTHKVNHYCQVEIAGDQMTVRAISSDRDTLDEFIINRDERPSHLLGFLGKADTANNISKAIIETNDQQTFADETGYYGMELEPGIYDVTYAMQNYYSIMASVEIFEGTETEFDTVFHPISVGYTQLDNTYEVVFCYPNPAIDHLKVRSEMNSSHQLDITMINTMGTSVRTWQFPAQMNQGKEYYLDLQGLPAGMYIVRLQNGNTEVTRKILKQSGKR